MKLHKFGLVLIILALMFVTVFSGATAKSSSEAVVTLSVDQAFFSENQEVAVTVTITNPTRHTIKVLSWYTPFPEVESPLFAVTFEGKPIAYTGAIYKRPAPTANDYLKLKAGESLISVVPLDQYYDLSASGTYAVTYAVASANLSEKAQPGQSLETLTSNTLELAIQGRAPGGVGLEKRPTPTPTPPPPGSTTFNRCSADQQTSLLTARSQANTYSDNALGYLTANKTGSRYTTWFGAVTASRYSHVEDNFSVISSAMHIAGVTFDCGCKKQYYAYVYPNQPYIIYLCNVFWQAPLTGTDSQAGTLIHEMSHFYVVASTDDYVYGQTGAMNLALTNPDQAVDNADNHEYFAENTPSLP